MDKIEILNRIKMLLNTQHFAVLATQSSDYPYSSLVGFSQSENCEEIIFATIRDTHKYRNLQKFPNVSLLIDSQTNQANDFKQAQALTVLGKSKEINDQEKKEYLASYLKKQPYLKEFVTANNCALIKISVVKYILVNDFQNIYEYSFESNKDTI
ncbi:MAG: pyridoxamine 5'-phosphate oxidase family protein [Candidatus Omnitrophica bacterium]|nr:pyridoxamine 5'-phosphate oxidase family protein [Candidatus Omnitrophota bacterium]